MFNKLIGPQVKGPHGTPALNQPPLNRAPSSPPVKPIQTQNQPQRNQTATVHVRYSEISQEVLKLVQDEHQRATGSPLQIGIVYVRSGYGQGKTTLASEVPKDAWDRVAKKEPQELLKELFGSNVKIEQPMTERVERNPNLKSAAHEYKTTSGSGESPQTKYSAKLQPDVHAAQRSPKGGIGDHSAFPESQIKQGQTIRNIDSSVNTTAWPIGLEIYSIGLADALIGSAQKPDVFNALKDIGQGAHPVTFALSGTTATIGADKTGFSHGMKYKDRSPVYLDRHDSEPILVTERDMVGSTFQIVDKSPLTAYVGVEGIKSRTSMLDSLLLPAQTEISSTLSERRLPWDVAYAAFVAQQVIKETPVNLDAAHEAVFNAFPEARSK